MIHKGRRTIFRNRYAQSRQGIAVLELVFGVVVFLLVAALVWMFILDRRAASRDDRREQDMKILQAALSSYAVALSIYSQSEKTVHPQCLEGAGCELLAFCGDRITLTSFLAQDLKNAGVLVSMPNDPLNPKSEVSPYSYYYASVPPSNSEYILSYCLEGNSIAGKKKGINQLRP